MNVRLVKTYVRPTKTNARFGRTYAPFGKTSARFSLVSSLSGQTNVRLAPSYARLDGKSDEFRPGSPPRMQSTPHPLSISVHWDLVSQVKAQFIAVNILIY